MDSLGLYVLAAAVLFGVGVYGLIVSEHLMRKLFAINIMGNAIFILLVAASGPVEGAPDPVPQALVLTGIVIAVSATAFALALMVRLYQETGQATLSSRDEGDDG
ncbi:MAG: NADH-quinone oxidoreductase subunit K [Wenzhouxiangella sp.]|nr:MAG: NADH-quinone oxidoreductase subunit K [Wenzhouxiangella sp.]